MSDDAQTPLLRFDFTNGLQRGSQLMLYPRYLVHRSDCETAVQRRIRTGMAERHLVRGVAIAMRFEALDVAAQRRKRAHACAHHAHCSQDFGLAGFFLITRVWLICS